MNDKSIVGDLINFRGLVYAPVNENGVIFLFGRVADDLNMYIEEIKPGFPDCIARRFVGKGWEKVAIEFEFKSSNFRDHKHDPKYCDLIVCWEHDWKDCPLEVIELKTEILECENYPITRPGMTEENEKEINEQIDAIIRAVSSIPKVRTWYDNIFDGLSKENDQIWAKVGRKYIGWYSPEKAFVSLTLKKNMIQIDCFSRGVDLPGTKVVNKRLSPRWVRFTVKSDGDVEKAIRTLKQSHSLIIEAIKSGEPTSFFSGGERPGSAKEVMESEEDEA